MQQKEGVMTSHPRAHPAWDGPAVALLTRCVVCSCSVAQLCPTLCDPMDCKASGFLVIYRLPDLAQNHVH